MGMLLMNSIGALCADNSHKSEIRVCTQAIRDAIGINPQGASGSPVAEEPTPLVLRSIINKGSGGDRIQVSKPASGKPPVFELFPRLYIVTV